MKRVFKKINSSKGKEALKGKSLKKGVPEKKIMEKEASRLQSKQEKTSDTPKSGFLGGAKKHFNSSSADKPPFLKIGEGEEAIVRMFGRPIIRMLHWATVENSKGQSYVVPIPCSDYSYEIAEWDGEKVSQDCPLCAVEAGESKVSGVSFNPRFGDTTLNFRSFVLCIDRNVQKESGTYSAIRIFGMSPMVYNRLIDFATPEEKEAEFASMKYRGDALSIKSGFNVRVVNTGSENIKEYYKVEPAKKDSPLTDEEIVEIKKWKADHVDWVPDNYYKVRDGDGILKFIEESVESKGLEEVETYKKASSVKKGKKKDEEEFYEEVEKEEKKEKDEEEDEEGEEEFEKDEPKGSKKGFKKDEEEKEEEEEDEFI